MRGITGKIMIEVMLILAALMVIVFGIPVVLGAIGRAEMADLVNKINSVQKLDDEGISFSLPEYVERIDFIMANDQGKCEAPNDLLVSVCYLCKDLEGKTFIVMRMDRKSKPTGLSVAWDLITLRPSKAKDDFVKMVGVSDQCYPKDFKSSFRGPDSSLIDPAFNGLVLTLSGSRDGEEKYCVTPVKKTTETWIYAKKGEC